MHLRDPWKRHHSQSKQKNPSIRVVVTLSAGPDPTFVSLSTNISLKLFPALLSTLTLYSVKKLTEDLHTLISEPVKPEWKVHAAAAHNFSAFLFFLFCSRIEFP
ncbi:hypothetical protein ILYODFUR_013586 [Ilyodon furcidens]|uniref:Uncharacterized protein n=1 Tax=Ilyodon furcidens TaxID=33524 RepID=A0ABV0SWR8_9TELE